MRASGRLPSENRLCGNQTLVRRGGDPPPGTRGEGKLERPCRQGSKGAKGKEKIQTWVSMADGGRFNPSRPGPANASGLSKSSGSNQGPGSECERG